MSTQPVSQFKSMSDKIECSIKNNVHIAVLSCAVLCCYNSDIMNDINYIMNVTCALCTFLICKKTKKKSN